MKLKFVSITVILCARIFVAYIYSAAATLYAGVWIFYCENKKKQMRFAPSGTFQSDFARENS